MVRKKSPEEVYLFLDVAHGLVEVHSFRTHGFTHVTPKKSPQGRSLRLVPAVQKDPLHEKKLREKSNAVDFDSVCGSPLYCLLRFTHAKKCKSQKSK